MNNFEFHNPVKICFGKGEIAKLPNLVPAKASILLVYGGGSILKNGIYDQVKNALKGFNILEFGGIEVNPDADLFTLMMVAIGGLIGMLIGVSVIREDA